MIATLYRGKSQVHTRSEHVHSKPDLCRTDWATVQPYQYTVSCHQSNMTSKGRYRGLEWSEFEEISQTNDKQTIKKQKCRHCGEKISPKIERLREHLKKCTTYQTKLTKNKEREESSDDISLLSFCEETEPGTSASTVYTPPLKRSASQSSISKHSMDSGSSVTVTQNINKFIYKTTEAEKKLFDLQFARIFYACNIPFSVAENEHMVKFIHMMRSGSYKPPNRRDVGGYLLDEVNRECEEIMVTELDGKNVTLIQDGWSNIHNQPIIGTCLHNGSRSYFIRSVDTGTEKKTANYCSELAEKEIDYCEEKFKCKVNYLLK